MERIRIGAQDWELCGDLACFGKDSGRAVLPDSDFQIRQWLYHIKDDLWSLSALRRLAGDCGLQIANLTNDDELLQQVEIAVRSGGLHLCRPAEVLKHSSGGAAQPQQQKKKQEAIPAATVRTKTWIEFEVVDMEGNPATGQRYVVMLPDGSLHEGNLGKTGVVRFEGIDRETCVFTLPDLDQEAWERL